MTTSNTVPNLVPNLKPRSRFNPRTWSTSKKLGIGLLGAVVLTGLWAAFRPEKLFVNDSVSESLATTGKNAPALLAQGSFASLAHHTQGSAILYKQGRGYLLRLQNFSTSNGPDVHLYLTQGAGVDNAGIKAGRFLDLGNLKGNIGNQNYTLPASFSPDQYKGVSIWCKRFAVNFAGTDLTLAGSAEPQPAAPQPAQAVTQFAEKPVTVTTGTFAKVGEGVQGQATISEDSKGNRTLTLSGFQSAKGPDVHVYLVKAENAHSNDAVKKAGYIDLGKLKSFSGTQTYSVPKTIDLWQYLAVTIWCDKFKVNFATAPLHSPQ